MYQFTKALRMGRKQGRGKMAGGNRLDRRETDNKPGRNSTLCKGETGHEEGKKRKNKTVHEDLISEKDNKTGALRL